jgi:hypothetical protein
MNTQFSDWIAGFIDGDGSFGLEESNGFYRPVLSIAQNDPQLLHKIKKFFGCGSVTRKNENAWHYRCRSTEQFQKFIIPKLGTVPFQTIKQVQYEMICNEAMPLLLNTSDPNRKAKLEDCLQKIKNSRNIVYVNPNKSINIDWFWGFFEAEGHFSLRVVNYRNSPSIRIGYKVTQKNRPLLEKILAFFGFGNIQSEGEGRSLKYSVEGVRSICQCALPILLKNPLKGKKNLERVKFIRAIRILLGAKSKNKAVDLNLISKIADELIKLRRL